MVILCKKRYFLCDFVCFKDKQTPFSYTYHPQKSLLEKQQKNERSILLGGLKREFILFQILLRIPFLPSQ